MCTGTVWKRDTHSVKMCCKEKCVTLRALVVMTAVTCRRDMSEPLFASTSGLASGRASTVRLCAFYFGDSSGNRPIFCFFRSSASVITNLQFHYRHVVFSSQVKSKVGNILVTPLTLSNLSPLNLVSIFRCHRPPLNPVYVSRLDP